jgi:hypothetical protein
VTTALYCLARKRYSLRTEKAYRYRVSQYIFCQYPGDTTINKGIVSKTAKESVLGRFNITLGSSNLIDIKDILKLTKI